MHKILKNKKALSEMVSYVILIVIALGMAAGVYSWMKIYVPSEDKQQTCSTDVSLMVKDYCIHEVEKTISLSLENKGLFDIDGFFILASKEELLEPTIPIDNIDVPSDIAIKGRYDFASPLEPNDLTVANFSYTDALPEGLKKIKMQPFILSKTNVVMCENRITIDIESAKLCA